MKKYFLVVLAIVAVVVLASGCTSNQTGNNTTKTYSANGITFNYPANWDIINETSNANQTLIAIGDANIQQNNTTTGNGVIITRLPTTNNTTAELQSAKSQFASLNATNTTIQIAGVTANETTITTTNDNITGQVKIIDFQKNNYVYLLQYVTISSNFQTQQALFDTITKSFQTQ